MGIDTEIVQPGSPEEIEVPIRESVKRLIDGTHMTVQFQMGENAGCVKVTDRNFNMVQGTHYHGTEDSDQKFSSNFIVKGQIKGLETQLEAEAKEKKTGFIRRKLVDITWEGGRLADLLNGDRELKAMLIQIGESPIIQPEPENQCVRVTTKPTKAKGLLSDFLDHALSWNFPPKEHVDACDRIAQHICSLGV
jgi:hypothetical protein